MKYLAALSRTPFFQYIIINNQDGTFFGMSNGPDLYKLLSGTSPPFSANDVATWLNNSDTESIKRLPGFLSVNNAVNKNTEKSQALQKMENLNVDTLPVIGKNGRFEGVVNRSRLTASLLIDVSQQLKNK
jgi:hypothetical protein